MNRGIGALIGALIGVTAALIIIWAVGFAEDRAAADDCRAAGGVPVQGDENVNQAVVCLSPESLLNRKENL